MSKFDRTFALNEEDKKNISEIDGKICMWILEGRSTGYMSEHLCVHPQEVEDHIDDMLYFLARRVGAKRFLEALFNNN